MLQISFIRQNTDLVKERLSLKNFAEISLVDKLIQSDEVLRKLKIETEALQANINITSKEIGVLMAKGDKAVAEQKKSEVAKLKDKLTVLSGELFLTEEDFKNDLLKLPNLPHSSVPKGKTPEENEIVKEVGTK